MSQDIEEALRTGDITPGMHDSLRLLTEDKAAAEAFQREMTVLTEELLGVERTRELGIRFFMQDYDYRNAGAFANAVPPIVIFTKGFIEGLTPENLSKLAGEFRRKGKKVPEEFEKNGKAILLDVLAHELKHLELNANGVPNSAGIEAECNNFAVRKLIELNYRPETSVENIEFYLTDPTKEEKAKFENLGRYLDVHPVDHLQIPLIQTTIFEAREGKGKIEIRDNAIVPPKVIGLENSPLFRGIKNTYTSSLDRLLEGAGYSRETRLGKLEIIREMVVSDLPQWDSDEHSTRVIELANQIRRLNVSRMGATPQEEAKVKEIADALLGVAPRARKRNWYGEHLYDTLARTWHQEFDKDYGVHPVGKYEELQKLLNEFKRTRSEEKAIALAREIEGMNLEATSPSGVNIPLFGLNPDRDLRKVLFIQQSIFDRYGLVSGADEIPDNIAREFDLKQDWHSHVGWAAANKETVPELTRLLYRLGVDREMDSRLPEIPENEFGEIHETIDNIYGQYKYQTAANGYITGISPTHDPVYYVDSDRQRYGQHINSWHEKIQQRRAETLQIDEADWSMVTDIANQTPNHNLKKFLVKYAPLFAQKMEDPKGTEFQRKFLAEISKIIPILDEEYQQIPLHRKDGTLYSTWYPNREILNYGNRLTNFLGYTFTDPGSEVVGLGGELQERSEKAGITLHFNHPYIQFLQNRNLQFEDQSYLMVSDKVVEAIARTTLKADLPDNEKLKFVRKHAEKYRKIFGYPEPETAEDLVSILKKLDNAHKEAHFIEKESKLSAYLASIELTDFLKKTRDAPLEAKYLEQIYKLGKGKLGLVRSPLFEETLTRYIKHHKAAELSSDAMELVGLYNQHQDSKLFKEDTKTRTEYEETIVRKINATQDIQERQAILEKLLLADIQDKEVSTERNSRFISEPNFRNWAIASWVECAAHMPMPDDTVSRIDNGSAEYLDRAKTVVETLMARSDGVTRYDMLTKWLNRIEAQQELSYHVRDRLKDVTNEQVAKLHLEVSVGSVFLDHLAFDPVFRDQTIRFFKKPCNKAAANAYAAHARESLNRLIHSKDERITDDFRHQLKRMQDSVNETIFSKDGVGAAFASQILHRNFASAPTNIRTAIEREILFPSHPAASPIVDDKGRPVDMQQYIFDMALPKRRNDQYVKYGRTLIGEYLGAIPENEAFTKQMYLAALMVAEDPSLQEPDPQVRTGKAIHNLLRSMDNVLAHKTSQAIDSSPNVPDWLRCPESKNSLSIPPRWVIHEMFQEHAPEEVKASTKRVGNVRAGAVGYAVELDKDQEVMTAENGYSITMPRTVFKMGREGRTEKVILHTPRIRQMIEKAAKKHPELLPAKPIIEHAIKSAQVEVDFNNAPLQAEIAHTLAEGMQVKIGERTFTIREVPFLQENSQSHEMAWAPGKLYNELPDSDPEKKIAAQVLLTAENYLAMSGYQMDWDRHGAQAIINGDTIYLIDRGGMALQPPSREDKELFGQTLANAFNAFVENGANNPDEKTKIGFEKAFTDAVDETADKKNGDINYYLATMSRAQHNMGDLRRELSADEQLQSLLAVFKSGMIDETIASTLMGNLSEATNEWIMAQGFDPNAMEAGIEISHPDNERWKKLDDTEALMQERMEREGQPIDWQVADIPEEYTPPPPVLSKYELPTYEMNAVEEEIETEADATLEVVVNNSDLAMAAKTETDVEAGAAESDTAAQGQGAGGSSSHGGAGHVHHPEPANSGATRLLEAGGGVAAAIIAYKSLESLKKDDAAKREAGEEPSWQSRVKKNAVTFAVVTGVALAADAVMGGHVLKAIMSKVKTGSWQSRL